MAELKVSKTYKLFIGGKFPRTESGRYLKVHNAKGDFVADISRASRKDFRESVVAARKAQSGWAGRTAYNRGQILYRIAEMLEGRVDLLESEMVVLGIPKAKANKEIRDAIDICVYYAGWADKYQQIFSSVNPVASSHFNFSVCEPTGVVAAIAPNNNSLSGLMEIICATVCGGNSLIVLASESNPLSAISVGEILQNSDLPGGVVNILTGNEDELVGHMVSHMDVNALIYCRTNHINQIKEESTSNIKRVVQMRELDGKFDSNPYRIKAIQEIKTTWHPIEKIGPSGSAY